jgi:hypothetical protein
MTRGGGGAPILIPIETWAKSVPPANNINTLNLFFTIRVLFSRLHFQQVF